MDSSNTDSIDLPNEIITDSKSNEEFQLLIKRINKILKQTEFDLTNGEYIYKEHCSELRRQVKLVKETRILKIEEITNNLMSEIDKFEKESLETVSQVNKEQLVSKLNEMKQENEKWNQRLYEFKVDNQMLNHLRDSLSKIAVERDNFKSLLYNKMIFKEYKDESFVGELLQVSLDSLDQILLQKQKEEIEKRYFVNDEDEYRLIKFEFQEGKISSDGDLFLCGKLKLVDPDSDRESNQMDFSVVLATFDLNRDFKIKKIIQFSVNFESLPMSSNRICLVVTIPQEDEHQLYFNRSEDYVDYEEYQESNDKAGVNSK